MQNNYYIEFSIIGVLKLNNGNRKELVRKLQDTILDFTEKHDTEIVTLDTSVTAYSESDIMNSIVHDPNEEH